MDDATGLHGRGNYMPSTMDTYRQTLMQQQAMDNLRYAAVQQGRPFANMGAQLMTGGGLDQMSASGRFIMEQAGGIMAARGWLGGGSAFQQMHGIMQAVGGGGFTVNGGMQQSATARFYGQGGLTGEFSRQLYDRVENHFFGGTAGANLHRTHGLNRSDIGMVFDQLKQRGSFEGMDIGSLEVSDTGRTSMKLNDRTADRIKEFIEDSAATLGSLREVFGDQSMDVLMKEAERISGMSFRGSGSAKEIRGRIETMQTQARMAGLDPRGYAEYDFATSGTTAGAMAARGNGNVAEHYRSAAAASPYITLNADQMHRDQQAAANRLAQQGRHLDVRSREEVAAFSAEAVAQFDAYEKTMLAADYAADNYQWKDPSAKGKLEELRMQWANAGSAEESQAARDGMRALVMEQTGMDTQKIVQGKSAEDMKRGITNERFAKRSEAFMMKERQASISSFSRINDMLGTSLSDEQLHSFFTTFNADTREALYQYRDTGVGASSLEDFMDKNGLNGLMSAGDLREIMRSDNAAGLRNVESEVMTRRDLMNLGNKQNDIQGKRDFATQWMLDNAYGGNRARMGITELLTQGLGGKITVDDLMLSKFGKEHMAGDIMSFGMNEAGGATLDDSQKAQMLKLIQLSGGDLAKMMGAASNEEAFRMLGTQEGMGQLMKSMSSSDMLFAMNFDENGKAAGFNLGTSRLREQGTKKLEEAAAVQREMALLGFSDEEEYRAYKASIMEQASGLEKQLYKDSWGDTLLARVMSDDDQLTKSIDNALDDKADPQGEAFMRFAKENASAMVPALQQKEDEFTEQAKDLKGEKKEAALKNAERVREMKEHLTKSGANHFLGYLQVNDGRSMALHSLSGGAKEAIDSAMAS